MNFYALGPLAYMNAVAGPSYRYHMVLAQYLYDNDWMPTDYFMYYRRRCSMRNYHVILDNGAYEAQKVSYDYLLRATMELNPQVVILPDVPHQMGTTLEGGEAFKALLKKNKWQGKTMTVVHAEPGNLEQFYHSYKEACKQSEWIGFSRLTENYGDGNILRRRAVFMTRLKEFKLYEPGKTHHALGMRDGSLEELCSLKLDFNSCDSSSPIWRGLTGNAADAGDFQPDACEDGMWIDNARTKFQEALEICK